MIYQGQVKFKATTLPLIMYHSSYTPAEKVVSPTQPFPDDIETTASETQPHDQQDDSGEAQEYDIDSNVREDLSNDEDELTFLCGIQTSRGQMIRVVRPQE